MKKLYIPIIIAGIAVLLTGCAIFTTKGRASLAEEKGRAKITSLDAAQSENTADKLDEVAGWAYGTDYALSKVNEPPREVSVARDINKRVVSIAGSPTVEKMKEMQEMIDKLTSELESVRADGKKKLAAKDKKILQLQNKSKEIAKAKETEIKNYMTQAAAAAAAADAYKLQLKEYEGWFGLKAVVKGLWQFIRTSMWVLLGGGILFFILRIAAFSNPIAASIFSIFTTIASWAINIIQFIVPKAVEAAGHTSTRVFDIYKGALGKIIDGIQIARYKAEETGKIPNIDDALEEIDSSMDSNEKEIIVDIKKSLNWK